MATTEGGREPARWWRRLGWLALLWAIGVLAMGLLSLGLRLIMAAAGLVA